MSSFYHVVNTIANTSGVYQSSDYQLTDDKTGAPISDRAGSKQFQASFRDLDLRLAFTGVAIGRLGGPRTVDLLSQELQALPQDSKFQDVCDALAKRCDAITRRFGSRGILEVVVTAATVAEPFRVAIVTNANRDTDPLRAKFPFRISESLSI